MVNAPSAATPKSARTGSWNPHVCKSKAFDTSANPQLVQQQNATLVERSAQGDVAAYITEAKRKAKIVKNPGVFE